MNRPFGIGLALIILAFSGSAAGAHPLPHERATTVAAESGADWNLYHGDPAGSGVAASSGHVDLSNRAWTSPALQGDIYGAPVVFGGQVFVSTEDDTVYALSAATGDVDWSTHLGTPVPSTALPCGNISPTVGITGTPVVDPGRSELFAVADKLVNGRPAHLLLGLSTGDGHVELSQKVDPPGADPAALLQRTGLTLDNGRVVFGMGGNYGDCASYRGRVISVPEAGGAAETFTVDSAPGQSQGAVWMGGAAPVVDAGANVWVSVGNGSVTSPTSTFDHSDSLLELSPTMTLLQYFAPTNWRANNANDLDLSTAPALLSDGQVIVAGKSRIVYLLDGAALGGIGHEESSLPDACNDDIDGGVAVEGTTVFLPCLSGTIAIRASLAPSRLRVLWRSSVGGGPPIVAGGLVWTIGQDGTLFGLDPSTGAQREHAVVGAPANHFPTPSVGAGRLLAASADHVIAFTMSSTSSTATSASSSSTTTVARSTTTSSAPAGGGGSGSLGGWVAVGAAIVIVVGGTVWILRRRRATP